MSDEMRIISSAAMRHADAIVSAFSKRFYNEAFRRAERDGRKTVEVADVDAVAADEIARPRLTDAERRAVETSFDAMQYAADELGLSRADCDRLIATLRGLLERTK